MEIVRGRQNDHFILFVSYFIKINIRKPFAIIIDKYRRFKMIVIEGIINYFWLTTFCLYLEIIFDIILFINIPIRKTSSIKPINITF